MNFSEKLQQTLGKSIKDAANEEIYAALLFNSKKKLRQIKEEIFRKSEGKYIIYQQNS